MTAWTYHTHSTILMRLVSADLLGQATAFDRRTDAGVVTQLEKLNQETSTATPQERAVAQCAIYAMYFDAVLLIASFIWWESRRKKFSSQGKAEKLRKHQ